MPPATPVPTLFRRPPTRRVWLCLAAVAAAWTAGCATPLHEYNDRSLARAIRRASEREVADAALSPSPIVMSRENRVNELKIDPRVMDQLETMAGPGSYRDKPLPTGPALDGEPQALGPVTLQRAVLSTVKRNLNVEFARLAPAISQAQLAAAEAAFDWVFFGNAQFSSTNAPVASQNFSSQTVNRRDSTDLGFGVRKSLISGASLTIQHQFIRTDNKSPGLVVRPNPANENNIVIQVDQPLLRNFGSDNALAQVRLARNTELDVIQQLKSTLLDQLTQTELAYWGLVRAQGELLITERLYARSKEVLGILEERRVFDAKPAVISDARSTAEQRRSDVLRAQRTLRSTSDTLKQLMNDPQFPVGAEILLVAADSAIDQPIQFSLMDSLQSAFQNRPEIWRSVLSTDSASIRQSVADNGRLPLLNVRALARLAGLGASTGDAYDDLTSGDFVDYQVGISFEQPIGNRQAESLYRQRRIERMQTVIVTRSIVQQIVIDVKSALRDIETNYALIEQTRAARIAAAENLRTLQVEEETLQGLTPEFLNLKLQRQQSLALAEQQEVQALTDYNSAIARLHQATGTALARNNIDFAVPALTPDPSTNDLFPDRPLVEPADDRVPVLQNTR